MFSDEQKKELSAPLSKSHVKSRTQGGRNVSYVEGWHAIAEANRIFGFDGWERRTIRLEETNRELVDLKNDRGPYKQWRVGYLAIVQVIADGVVRQGTGFGSGMAKPEALGEAIESAAKEAETDAMKRALMTFGNPFGLALYDKEQTNVAEETRTEREAPRSVVTSGRQQTSDDEPSRADDLATDIMDDMSTAKSIEGLNSVAAHRRPEIDQLPEKQANRVRAHYQTIKNKIAPRRAA